MCCRKAAVAAGLMFTALRAGDSESRWQDKRRKIEEIALLEDPLYTDILEPLVMEVIDAPDASLRGALGKILWRSLRSKTKSSASQGDLGALVMLETRVHGSKQALKVGFRFMDHDLNRFSNHIFENVQSANAKELDECIRSTFGTYDKER